MDTHDDLIDPLQLTEQSLINYLEHIGSYSRPKLADDYQMIWLSVPKPGYDVQIKPLIKVLRHAIIDQLKLQPPVPWQPRLITRLPEGHPLKEVVAQIPLYKVK